MWVVAATKLYLHLSEIKPRQKAAYGTEFQASVLLASNDETAVDGSSAKVRLPTFGPRMRAERTALQY
jgi:hypothetical protein